MLRESHPFVSVAVNLIMALLVVVGIGQLSGFFYEADKSDFITLDKPPVIYSPRDWKPTEKFHPGEAMIIENQTTKREIGCYAEYQYSLVGPVNYSVSAGKSRNIHPRGTTHSSKAKGLFQIPRTLPTGVYRLQLIVFPICDGIPRDPFNIYKDHQPWVQVYGDPIP